MLSLRPALGGVSALAFLAVVPCAGCAGREPVSSCDDPLGGVWETAGGERYHIVENRTGIEIFAMFDTAIPPDGDKRASPVVYAPFVFDLRRRRRPGGTDLRGRWSQRLTREGHPCTLQTRAVIERCDEDGLALRYQRPGPLDWTHCRQEPTEEWVELSLCRH